MWMLENVQRSIREPHCANLVHSDLEVLHQARADLRQAGHGHPFFWTPFSPVEQLEMS
jgi:hypothetical protein